VQQPRLADARLAAHENDATVAPAGRLEASAEEGQLPLAANQK
jgi:hypothetical protein